VISPGACQIAVLLPASRSSHNVIAVGATWIKVLVLGKMAAASVGVEAILEARSVSVTSGDKFNSDVEIAVEYKRLEGLMISDIESCPLTHCQ